MVEYVIGESESETRQKKSVNVRGERGLEQPSGSVSSLFGEKSGVASARRKLKGDLGKGSEGTMRNSIFRFLRHRIPRSL